ncbi:MAG: class I SAM-dependent methyltransferase [Acidimicrobiia bacterium]
MATWSMANPEIPGEIFDHYSLINEEERLARGDGPLEEARTRVLIERQLPAPPAEVADIGGGAGAYAHWLAAGGYTVHLRDPMPGHIEIATSASADSATPLASVAVGDGRAIDLPDGSVEAVLLLGPLYHLTEPADRIGCLQEARRVLRPGGVVLAATTRRQTSFPAKVWGNLLADPIFRTIVDRDLAEGQHRNPTGNSGYFTTAYFHRPDDLRTELGEAGFSQVDIRAVEGVGWIMPDFDDRWADEESRAIILEMVALTDSDPDIMGVSPHLLGTGRKTG